MSTALESNADYAEKMKRIMRLRYEPVAVKLVREGESFPPGLSRPEKQMSHCQAVFAAKNGSCLEMRAEDEQCHVGASCLGMMPAPGKVVSGEFHASIGMHDSPAAAAAMIAARRTVPGRVVGEAVCPLAKADFVPDVVDFVDIPERIYWFVPLSTAAAGGRASFSTAPFQCACEDTVALPIITGEVNVSLGCFGCRRKTDMKADEMAAGVPYAKIPGFVERLERYEGGVMAKAERDRRGAAP